MSLYKRGNVYWYDFYFDGRRYQGSTFLKNKELAKQVAAKVRNDAALALHGIAPRRAAPLFKDFLEGPFLEHVRQTTQKPNTRLYYEHKVKRLLEFPGFADKRLDAIDTLAIQAFSEWRPKQKKRWGSPGFMSIAAVNGELRTLRRALRFAADCGLIVKAPRVRQLPGEKPRLFVLSGELEVRYLSLCPSPLKEAAILILDLGLRPDEVVRLRKVDITQDGVHVRVGKSDNARRSLPHTDRTRHTLEFLFAFFPDSEWVFPGRKDHLKARSLENTHAKLREKHGWPKDFVLYAARHTYGTRLAQSGASPFDICKLMGHSRISVSERYIHIGSDHLTLAAKRKEAYDRILRGEAQEETSIEGLVK